jgi:hypothetical protein
VTSSTSFEAMGDSHSHRIRSSVRDFCAHQRCIRIDFKGDRDQRQYKNDNQGSHGPACSGEMRQHQPKKPAENGSFIAGTCKTRWREPAAFDCVINQTRLHNSALRGELSITKQSRQCERSARKHAPIRHRYRPVGSKVIGGLRGNFDYVHCDLCRAVHRA